jgi:CRP-like cAMP-binding protein
LGGTKLTASRNLLVQSLSDGDLSLISPFMEPVVLREEEVILLPESRIDYVFFLETGVASYASVPASGHRTGIGTIGYEGCIGWHLLLGCNVSPYEVTLAVGGAPAHRIAANSLLEACNRSPSLHSHLMRFVRSFMIQLGQTIVSNLNDPVERRLCRWLLMNHDRLEGEQIKLTHAQIGEMLGVRRASVTDALHVLEGEGLIRSVRGCITIRDRQKLRGAAGENYGIAEAEYSRLIAPFGKDAVTAAA